MSEIKPMLLTEVDYSPEIFETYKGWLFQEKQNGIRAIVHIKKGRVVAIRNRRNTPIAHLFPEFQALNFSGIENAIIDGEMCVLQNDKSIFYGGINQRDKKLYTENVVKFPITFVAFDVLYLNNEVVVDKSYSERYALLKQAISGITSNSFKIAGNIENSQQFWNEKIVKENREGLVIKNPQGKYEVDTRSKNNIKLKNYKKVDVVVDKTEQNPKGFKIYGKVNINGVDVDVECQVSGKDIKVDVGEVVPVVYLDIVGNKLIQPHKVKGYGLN